MRRLGFLTICAVVVLVAVARVDVAGARPMDSIVTGCTTASGGNFCITVTKGRKNFARHRQWVVSIHMWSERDSLPQWLGGVDAELVHGPSRQRLLFRFAELRDQPVGADEQLRLRARLLQHDECYSLHRDSGLAASRIATSQASPRCDDRLGLSLSIGIWATPAT